MGAATMLFYGILSFNHKSQCLNNFHGLGVFHLKRLIMQDQAKGRVSNLIEGDDGRS